jgi:hypothetical protein
MSRSGDAMMVISFSGIINIFGCIHVFSDTINLLATFCMDRLLKEVLLKLLAW